MEKELMLVALRFALLANYAQRSGRAGRSGEAAMRIDTDEWFRPKSAARIDLFHASADVRRSNLSK